MSNEEQGIHTLLNSDARRLFDHLEGTFFSTDSATRTHRIDKGHMIQDAQYFIAYEAARIVEQERGKVPKKDQLDIDDYKPLAEDTYKIGFMAGLEKPRGSAVMTEYVQTRMHGTAEPGLKEPEMSALINDADVPGLDARYGQRAPKMHDAHDHSQTGRQGGSGGGRGGHAA